MDLFVVTRYKDQNEEDLRDLETKNLQKLKQKIEERKRQLYANKKPETITLQDKGTVTSKEAQKESPIEIEDIPVPVLDDKEKSQSKVDKDGQKKATLDFKVLGNDNFENKLVVHRVLPYWLSHPEIVKPSLQKLTCSVEGALWLHDTLKSTLITEGVTHLFPVQEKVIPFILQEHKLPPSIWPQDICVSAPTGSGKTLTFVLPLIQVLMNDISHCVRALVVLPVQELASQVAKVFKKYCLRTGLKVALLSGSTPLLQEQSQIVRFTESKGWQSEVDIIVCTAGRLVEHLQNTEGFSLKHLRFLVIDEADRIMDHIQNDWLYHLDRHIKLDSELMTGKMPTLSWNSIQHQKRPPQKLLFSATLSQDPEKLDQWGLFQPKLFSTSHTGDVETEQEIRKYSTPEELQEKFVTCEPEYKPLVLYNFLVEQKWDKVLCFTNSAQSAHRLTVLLNIWSNGVIKASEISASLDRQSRENVLKKFTNSEITVLIGTDALARGIDIPNCDYVISYDPPRNIKTYIHRVGRTGRAGRIGNAVSILLPNQIRAFKELLQSGGKSEIPQLKIREEDLDRLVYSYDHAIKETKTVIDSEQENKVKKSITIKRGNKEKTKKRKHSQI